MAGDVSRHDASPLDTRVLQGFENRGTVTADRVKTWFIVDGDCVQAELLARHVVFNKAGVLRRGTQEIESRVSGRGSEILAWLDGLEIVALRSLTVLERPLATDVVVEASGDVFWRLIEGDDEEQRHDTLRLVGRPPRWPE